MAQQQRPRQGKHIDEDTDQVFEAAAGDDAADAVAEANEAFAAEKAELLARIEKLEEANAALVREEKYRLAEFDTFRRRTRQEQEELRKSAARDLLAELLDIEDGFINAEAGWSESDPAAWREGIQIIARKFASILEKHGVEPIDGEGSAFDPAIHVTVLLPEGCTQTAALVAYVSLCGYLVRDKVHRLAKVKVARGLG
jgi:molecular chaperone GrpE